MLRWWSFAGSSWSPSSFAKSDTVQTVAVFLTPLSLENTNSANNAPKLKADKANTSNVRKPAETSTTAVTMPLTALQQSKSNNVVPPDAIGNAFGPASAVSSPSLYLGLDNATLQNAAREADRNLVRRLARESGQLDIFDSARPDPLKRALADMSEPRCPPRGMMRGMMREARGDRMQAPMPDRSGDCEHQRSERVRERALGR